MIVATLGIILRGNWMLLGRKKKAKMGTGLLNGPGGGVEREETLTEGLVRETKEEFDILLSEEELKKVVILHCYVKGELHMIVHVYLVGNYSGTPKETTSMYEPQWHFVCNGLFRKMHEADRQWLLKYLSKHEPFDAHVYYRKPGKRLKKVEYHPFSG
jgi:ADP-ribose pyrophosphatase YjhB (NUDIX family)